MAGGGTLPAAEKKDPSVDSPGHRQDGAGSPHTQQSQPRVRFGEVGDGGDDGGARGRGAGSPKRSLSFQVIDDPYDDDEGDEGDDDDDYMSGEEGDEFDELEGLGVVHVEV